ncbi:MAG: hypothetical protein ACJ8F1_00200 [Polyangia bacterium]
MTWFLVLPFATTLLANVPAAPPEPTIEPVGAEPSPPFTGAPQEPASGWYGAPALVVDAAVAVGITLVVDADNNSSQSGPPAVLYGLAAAYLLAGPVVHLVHGNGLRSAESLLVRIGALAAGVAVMYALVDPLNCNVEVSERGPCRAPYALALAPLTAMLLDDVLLARDAPAQRARTVSTRVLVQPGLALLGIGGSF